MYLLRLIKIILLLVAINYASVDQNLGYLSIKSDRPVTVFLNDMLISNDEFEFLALKPGKYNLEILSNSDLWTERTYQKNIAIIPDKHHVEKVKFNAPVLLNTEPFGSEIYIDNQLVGQTPAYIDFDQNKGKNFKLVLSGYKEQEFTLTDSLVLQKISLSPLSPNREPYVLNAESTNNYNTVYKHGFLVTSVLSSWAAFYLKREADKNYDKYLQAGDPDKIEKYFNRTTRLDRFSEAAAVISISTLGVYLYFLIFD